MDATSTGRPPRVARVGKAAMVLVVALLVGATAVPPAADAHTRSYSYSQWEMDRSPPRVTVRLRQYDLTRLHLHPTFTLDYDRRVADLVVADLGVRRGSKGCRLEDLHGVAASEGWVSVRGNLRCDDDEAARLSIRSDLLLDQISQHLHFATVRRADGRVVENVLTYSDREWKVVFDAAADGSAPDVAVAATVGGYWMLGVEHILGGADHLAFVAGLLLLATTLAELGWLITGFTVAHSLTLALAVLGHVRPAAGAVEALIGLSIALVAVEAAWERDGRPAWLPASAAAVLVGMAALAPSALSATALAGVALFVACYFALLGVSSRAWRWRLLLAFAFGLFHGFGFAGILVEMSLPDARLVPALLGFNLGVEAGQLLVVALAWPLLRRLRSSAAVDGLAIAGIAACGMFWFVTRAFS